MKQKTFHSLAELQEYFFPEEVRRKRERELRSALEVDEITVRRELHEACQRVVNKDKNANQASS